MNPFMRYAYATAHSVVICREDVKEKKEFTFKTLIPENVFKKDKCVFLHNMISAFTHRRHGGFYFNITFFFFAIFYGRLSHLPNAHMVAHWK